MLLVLCTFPDLERARQIGTLLVEKQLAACVNLLPGVESIYRWEGQVESAGEVIAIFKTTREAFSGFRDALAESHPYEVPEILALEAASESAPYLRWLIEETEPSEERP